MRLSMTVVSAMAAFGVLAWPVLARVAVETVPVGNVGNEGQLSGGASLGQYVPERTCGSVSYTYSIGKYEVTAAQYTDFLNAVAGVDTYGLYNPSMWSSVYGCKIERYAGSGAVGDPYRYQVACDWARRPVNFVSFWDACRFTNWLHNGQLNGGQVAGTTETGAYTLNGYNGNDGRLIQRNADWTWAITSEDEWYKAAYHKNDGVTGNYWVYPTRSNAAPTYVDNEGNYSHTNNPFVQRGADPGNCATYDSDDVAEGIGNPYYRTEVGEWENSASPYGTFDQGGNVWEWNESVIFAASRNVRGGSFGSRDCLYASCRHFQYSPSYENSDIGFRVSAVPEPASIALLALSAAGVLVRPRSIPAAQ